MINSALEDNGPRVPQQVQDRANRAREALKPKDEVQPVIEPSSATPAEAAPVEPVVQVPATPLPDQENLLGCPPDKLANAEYWRHRASCIDGIMKKDRSRFQAQLEAQNVRIAELQSEIVKLQTAKPVTEEDIDLSQYFTPEAIEELGEDQARHIAKTSITAAKRIATDEIEKAVEPIRQQSKNSEKAVLERKAQEFEDKLTELVPGHLAIDDGNGKHAAGWEEFLLSEDPASGITRNELLQRHARQYNAKQVARIFNQFIDSQGTRVPVPATPPVLPAGNVGNNGAAPAAPAFAGPQGLPNAAEIRDFYKRSALGKVSDEERKHFEARIKAAQNVGQM